LGKLLPKEEDEAEVVQLVGVLRGSSGEIGLQWWGRRGSSSMALVDREVWGERKGERE
jgi:hypothetical protein